jgi:hypothetical protein
MRVSARTRGGIGVYTGLGGLLLLGFAVGPVLLMFYMLAGVVRLAAWVVREIAASRADRQPGNRVAPPNRHH